jgi:hypothetical protein
MWHRISDHHVEKKSEADTIFSELKAYQVFDWCELTDEDWRSPRASVADLSPPQAFPQLY